MKTAGILIPHNEELLLSVRADCFVAPPVAEHPRNDAYRILDFARDGIVGARP